MCYNMRDNAMSTDTSTAQSEAREIELRPATREGDKDALAHALARLIKAKLDRQAAEPLPSAQPKKAA